MKKWLGIKRAVQSSLLVTAACATSVALASQSSKTIVEKRISATLRLQPLKKISVGPDDQYAGVLHPNGQYLVFVKKVDLVAHLQIQNLATGDVTDLLPLNADSQEAIFAPDGRLAFVYFKNNARGDVCFTHKPLDSTRTLNENDFRCLTDSRMPRRHLFWRSDSEIGFLESQLGQANARVMSVNTLTGATQVLAEGQITSPTMSADGQTLVYLKSGIASVESKGIEKAKTEISKSVEQRIVVVRFGSSIGSAMVAQSELILQMPGISGFPQLSADGHHLYLSHFPNDTNHDRTLDGADHSVILRLDLRRIKPRDTDILPEQLTSVGTSCSYPRIMADRLLVSCAFEGSLDTYEAPKDGMVPVAWSLATLESAIRTSRSYEDRILLLNAIRYRFPRETRQTIRRLLSTHLLNDDVEAALYYLDFLRASTKSDDVFLAQLKVYLLARDLKKSQLSNEISREFRQSIGELQKGLTAVSRPSHSRMDSLVRAWFAHFLGEDATALKLLKSPQGRAQENARAIEDYLQIELVNEINSTGIVSVDLERFYLSAMQSSAFDDQTRLHYGYELLRQFAKREANLASRTARVQNVLNRIGSASSGLAVKKLLQSELVVLRVLDQKADSARLPIYRELDALMDQARDDYYLRKTMYVRAIVNFATLNDIKYLGLVASKWISFTQMNDTEFIYARELFSSTALEQAYHYLELGNLEFANNYFFQSLSLTDDLESHLGYVTALLKAGKRQKLETDYQNLIKREFIDDNFKFVQALLILSASVDGSSLDAAIGRLAAMKQDQDSPIRYLLLGYCYLEKMLLKREGIEFNRELFQKAHRNLMLAYDLGRDNERVLASALTNLGILHQSVGNHALAARFLSNRSTLGFTSDVERADHAWLLASQLLSSRQSSQAATVFAQIQKPDLRRTEVIEREALALLDAGQFAKSAQMYAGIIARPEVTEPENFARVGLSYGLSLFKSGQANEARAQWQKVLTSLESVKSKAKGESESGAPYDPRRMKAIVFGLLARTGTATEKLQALSSRIEILRSDSGLFDDQSMQLIESLVQKAALLTALEDVASVTEAGKVLHAAIELGLQYGEDNLYFGNGLYQLANAALIFYSQFKPLPEVLQKLDTLTTKILAEIDKQKQRTPILDSQSETLRKRYKLLFGPRVASY